MMIWYYFKRIVWLNIYCILDRIINGYLCDILLNGIFVWEVGYLGDVLLFGLFVGEVGYLCNILLNGIIVWKVGEWIDCVFNELNMIDEIMEWIFDGRINL